MEERPEGAWYIPLVSSAGVFLTSVGVLLLLIMLSVLIGPFTLVPSSPGIRGAGERLQIWEPESSLSRSQAERSRRLDAWRALIPEGAEASLTRGLAALRGERRGFVIVSDAGGLSGRETEALLAHLRRGGGVLLAGWIGAREGGESQLTTMRRLLDVESVGRLRRKDSHFVAAARRGPLVAGLLPSERLGLAADQGPPAIDAADAELIWSDWALRRVGRVCGASRRRSVGRGRLVWMAPSPESALGDANAIEHLRRIVAAAIAWGSRRPYAELLAWPRAAPFAGLLAIDLVDQFENALPVAAGAERERLPITFMALSGAAGRFPEVVSRLAEVGEVGSHADVYERFGQLSYPRQLERLRRSRDELRALGIDEVQGFRPPHEEYDPATERALVEAGFSYLLGDQIRHSMVPRVVSVAAPGSELIEIPRTVPDDYELLVRRGIRRAADLEAQMREDLERVERRGGLYYFSSRTQYFNSGERVDLLLRIGALLKSRRAWLTTGVELADWWRRRAGCSIRAEGVGAQRLRLHVTNDGDSTLDGVAIRVHLNSSLLLARVSGTKLFQTRPLVRDSPTAEHLDLILPELAPGRSYAYDLDFEAVPGSLQEPLRIPVSRSAPTPSPDPAG